MFEYLKEWSPVFSFFAMIIFAIALMIIDNKYRKELRHNRKLDEIIQWANECISLPYESHMLGGLPQSTISITEKTKLISKMERLSMESVRLQKNLLNNKKLGELFYTCTEEMHNLFDSLCKQGKEKGSSKEYSIAFGALIAEAVFLKT